MFIRCRDCAFSALFPTLYHVLKGQEEGQRADCRVAVEILV